MRTAIMVWVFMFFAHSGAAQRFAGEKAWKQLFEHEGVRFLYVFYPRADSADDGVVMMLQNQNAYAVAYRFTVIFESPEGTSSADVEGVLESMEMKTGDVDGLFWIPFDDGRALGAIRMRNYRITRIEDSSSASECDSVCI